MQPMARSADAFDKQQKKDEEARADTWEPEEGDFLWGVLTRADIRKTKFGLSVVINLKNTDKLSGGIKKGSNGAIWLSAGLLPRFLAADGMPALGTEIGIRYEGKQKVKSGNTMKAYTVVFPTDDDDKPDFTQDRERWEKFDAQLNDDGSGRRERSGSGEEPEGGWF